MSQAEQVAAEVPHRESKRHFGEPGSPNASKAPSIIKHHQAFSIRSKLSFHIHVEILMNICRTLNFHEMFINSIIMIQNVLFCGSFRIYVTFKVMVIM